MNWFSENDLMILFYMRGYIQKSTYDVFLITVIFDISGPDRYLDISCHDLSRLCRVGSVNPTLVRSGAVILCFFRDCGDLLAI